MKKYTPGYRQSVSNSLKSNPPVSNFKPRSVRKIENKAKRNLIISIIIGAALLIFLITWGLPALIGGLTVFNNLKGNNTDNIANQDEEEAIAPPVLNIPFEATNSATLTISGYSNPNSKVEIYLDDKLKDITTTDSSGSFKSGVITLALGTNNINGKTVLSDNQKSLASKNIRVIYSNVKPKLEIKEPKDGQQIISKEQRLKVAGATDPNNSITVNSMTAVVNNQGNFETYIMLSEGENIIKVMATNSVGNSNQMEVKVTYTLPTPTPSPEPTETPEE